MITYVPAEAHKQDGPCKAKSYTLKQEGSASSIGVLLYRKAYYVHPVEALPQRPKFEAMNINKQKGVSIGWGEDAAEAFSLAKTVASWD